MFVGCHSTTSVTEVNGFALAGAAAKALGCGGACLGVDSGDVSGLTAVHLATRELLAGVSSAALVVGVHNSSTAAECVALLLTPARFAVDQGCHVAAMIATTAMSHHRTTTTATATATPKHITRLLQASSVDASELQLVVHRGQPPALADQEEELALLQVHDGGHAAGLQELLQTVLMIHHQRVTPATTLPSGGPATPQRHIDAALVTAQDASGRVSVDMMLRAPGAAAVSRVRAHSAGSRVARGRPSGMPLVLPLCAASAQGLRDAAKRALAEVRHVVDKHSEDDAALVHARVAQRCDRAVNALEDSGAGSNVYRKCLVAPTPATLVEQLEATAASDDLSPVDAAAASKLRILATFPGHESHRPAMGKELYDTVPPFRAAINECDALFRQRLGFSVAEVMFRPAREAGTKAPPLSLERILCAAPAIFTMGYALWRLWEALGVSPMGSVGHSQGEIAASVVAGVLSLRDAVLLLSVRAKLMDQMPSHGTMYVVFASQAAVQPHLKAYNRARKIRGGGAGDGGADDGAVVSVGIPEDPAVVLGCINGPKCVVLSGPTEGVTAVAKAVASEGFRTIELPSAHGFHSQCVRPLAGMLDTVAALLRHQPPSRVFASTALGRVLPPGDTTLDGASHWGRHAWGAVRFFPTVASLVGDAALAPRVCLEMGATGVVSSMGRRCFSKTATNVPTWIPTLTRRGGDLAAVVAAAAQLFDMGLPVRWAALGCFATVVGAPSVAPAAARALAVHRAVSSSGLRLPQLAKRAPRRRLLLRRERSTREEVVMEAASSAAVAAMASASSRSLRLQAADSRALPADLSTRSLRVAAAATAAAADATTPPPPPPPPHRRLSRRARSVSSIALSRYQRAFAEAMGEAVEEGDEVAAPQLARAVSAREGGRGAGGGAGASGASGGGTKQPRHRMHMKGASQRSQGSVGSTRSRGSSASSASGGISHAAAAEMTASQLLAMAAPKQGEGVGRAKRKEQQQQKKKVQKKQKEKKKSAADRRKAASELAFMM